MPDSDQPIPADVVANEVTITGKPFVLSDADFVLVTTVRELTQAIRVLSDVMRAR